LPPKDVVFFRAALFQELDGALIFLKEHSIETIQVSFSAE